MALETLKFDTNVKSEGKIEMQVPYSPGTKVTVFVVLEKQPDDDFRDLFIAAQKDLSFWDNPYDDKDWNNA